MPQIFTSAIIISNLYKMSGANYIFTWPWWNVTDAGITLGGKQTNHMLRWWIIRRHIFGLCSKLWFMSFSDACALCLSNFLICDCARHSFVRIASICPPISTAPKPPPITKALTPNSQTGISTFWVNGHNDRLITASFDMAKLTANVTSATVIMIQSSRPKKNTGGPA